MSLPPKRDPHPEDDDDESPPVSSWSYPFRTYAGLWVLRGLCEHLHSRPNGGAKHMCGIWTEPVLVF